jgi:hypothetical protein
MQICTAHFEVSANRRKKAEVDKATTLLQENILFLKTKLEMKLV